MSFSPSVPNTPHVFISSSVDPYANLSLENWLFRNNDPTIPLLLLYRNRPSIVLGRFQNPWKECRLSHLSARGIDFVRRQSGGGTVYHDLGNLNFSFINGEKGFGTAGHFEIILNAIHEFDIPAYANYRHDLVVDDQKGETKKISGSAFKKTRDRSLHHGTLLLNASLDELNYYLKPKPKDLATKAIASVPSQVLNLSSLNHVVDWQRMCQQITKSFYQKFDSGPAINQVATTITEAQALAHSDIMEHFIKLKEWDWTLGETPRFHHKMESSFTWGMIKFELECHKGRVIKVEITSAELHPGITEQMSEVMKDEKYDFLVMSRKLNLLAQAFPMYRAEIDDCIGLLEAELN